MTICEQCAALPSIDVKCPVCDYTATLSPVPVEQPVCPKCGCCLVAVQAQHPHSTP